MGYIEYDKAYFSELSVQFNIAVNKVISLIERGDLKYGSQKCDSEIAVLLELARKYHASKSDLNQHDCFYMPVANKILKNGIEATPDRYGRIARLQLYSD